MTTLQFVEVGVSLQSCLGTSPHTSLVCLGLRLIPITHQILSNLGLVTQDFFGTLVHSVSWWNSATWRIICKYINIDADNVVEEKVDADDDDDCDDDDDDIANLSANLLGHGSTRRGRLVGALKIIHCRQKP